MNANGHGRRAYEAVARASSGTRRGTLNGTSATAWLGFDLGTQGCRVTAVDEEGRLIARAESDLVSARPAAGRHEQDPETWKTAVSAACRQVVSRLQGQVVAGLAVCATSGTFLVADRAGRPLTPALMYDDARATAELSIVAEAWAACAARNGYRVQPTWAIPKLLWTLRNVAGAAKGRLYHAADFVGSWLAGEPVATDTSHALKTGFDLAAGRWASEAFDAVGIPTSVLPPVVRPGTVVGLVCAGAASATGLSPGTRVIAGMTDGCAAQIASGAMHVGQWNSSLGTTFILKGVSSRLLHDSAGAVYSHSHPDGGWLPGGASNSGAGVLASVFPGADLARMDRAAAAYMPTEVVRYPLAFPGERFPFVRPDAEPFTLGTPRDDAELFAALLQGVAFVERLSLAYVEALGAEVTGPVAFTGGATHSDHWTQLRVDVLGRPARLPCHPDGAVGVAIVAAAGSGSVTKAADRMVHTSKVVEPRPDRTERYLEIYRRMIDELERRGYIDAKLATSARAA